MKVTDFINGEVTYDKFGGQYFWINDPKGGSQMLAEMRGWGAIQNMFKGKGGAIDMDKAGEFQDAIGDFVAQAINEKVERDKGQNLAVSEIVGILKKLDNDKWNEVMDNFCHSCWVFLEKGDVCHCHNDE